MFSFIFISYAEYNGVTDEVKNDFSISEMDYQKKYNITYNLDGGHFEVITDALFQYNYSNYGYVPQTPSRDGYVFLGWSPESIAEGSTGDIVFTALWRQADAILEPGRQFSADIKNLVAGVTDSTEFSVDNLVSSIQLISSDNLSDDIETIEVQDDSSDYIIKAYSVENDNNKRDVFLVCDADTIYLNTDCSYMFDYFSDLTSLDLSKFNTSKVTNMSNMFRRCEALSTLDLSNFDTSQVTNMLQMFSTCSSLTSLNVSNFDTSKVTNMQAMFYKCSSLTSLNLSNFNTSKLTTMYIMFYDCSKLSSLDVSGFDTTSITNMQSMFSGCSSLAPLDLSSFNTSNVTSMKSMFYNCKSLTFLNLSDFDMTNVTSKESMLSGTASTSKGCAVVCIESVETALKSGTSITSSYFTFVRSLDDLVQTSSISLDMNDDSGEVYNFSLLQ